VPQPILFLHEVDGIVIAVLRDRQPSAKRQQPSNLAAFLELRQQKTDNINATHFVDAQLPVAIVALERRL